MAEKGKRCEETAGLQWFELNNEVHTFVVHNQNHPQMIEIHAELKRLSGLIHDAVYVPSMKFVLNEMEEDGFTCVTIAKKLTTAFTLINTAPCTPLQKYEICGFVKSAMLTQSSIQK
jgi:hypothetical protein